MRFQLITIFPELIEAFGRTGLIARASESGLIRVDALSPRRFATDKHLSVDDAPYGGGSGMVMLPEPMLLAMEAFDQNVEASGATPARRVLLTPQGRPFTQADARRLAAEPRGLMLICGL
jgi:tRNA (guanine37-N1)-methyltransferase